MNDRDIERLMLLTPEEYIEEVLQFEESRKPLITQTKNPAPRAAAAAAASFFPALRKAKYFKAAASATAVAAGTAAAVGVGVMLMHQEALPMPESSVVQVTELTASGTLPPELTALLTESTPATTTTTTTTAKTTASETTEKTKSSAKKTTETTQKTTTTASSATTAQTTSRSAAVTQRTTETAAATTTTTTAPRPVYQMGDVNLDGIVNNDDAQLVLADYQAVVLDGKPSILTDEQRALADVYTRTDLVLDRSHYQLPVVQSDYPLNEDDATMLMNFYTARTSNNCGSSLTFDIFSMYYEDYLHDKTAFRRYGSDAALLDITVLPPQLQSGNILNVPSVIGADVPLAAECYAVSGNTKTTQMTVRYIDAGGNRFGSRAMLTIDKVTDQYFADNREDIIGWYSHMTGYQLLFDENTKVTVLNTSGADSYFASEYSVSWYSVGVRGTVTIKTKTPMAQETAVEIARQIYESTKLVIPQDIN